VHGVKCSPFGGKVPTERQFERWLVRDAGFTRSEARSLMRSGLSGLKSLRDAGKDASDDAEELTTAVRRLTALIKSATS
jgi:hypothetical protein